MPSDELKCHVGDVLVPARFLSSTTITCEHPGQGPPGPVEVALTDNGVDYTHAGSILVLPRTTITSLSIFSGPLSGGTKVLVEGTGFSNLDAPSCSFGGTIVAAQVRTPTEASCTTPPAVCQSASCLRRAISVPIAFSNNGADFEDYSDSFEHQGPIFTFYPDPVVSRISPLGGITHGEPVTITIYGYNFGTHTSLRESSSLGYFLCRLGGDSPMMEGEVISESEAFCALTCGNTSGLVGVEVSLNGGSHWTATHVGFRCEHLPVVASISPRLGPTIGGTVVTVRGTGFASAATSLTCLLDDGKDGRAVIPAVWVSHSLIECSMPAFPRLGEPTFAAISVSNDGVHFSASVDTAAFEYVLSPTVSQVTPKIVSVSGSAPPLVVTGTNFINSTLMSCRFQPTANLGGAADIHIDASGGSTPSITVTATFVSTTVVLCAVPGKSLDPGPVLLTVSINGINFDHSGVTVELEALPHITGVVPSRVFAGPTTTPVEVGGSTSS